MRFINPKDIRLDDANPNKHTERGVYMVETSLERYGAARSAVVARDGLVLAGNATLQAAIEKGFRLAEVEVDGRTLVVVKRTDLAADDPKAIEYKVADNRASEVGLAWDTEVLAEMAAAGLPMPEFFFEDELKAIFGHADAPPEFPRADPAAIAGQLVHECPRCHFRFAPSAKPLTVEAPPKEEPAAPRRRAGRKA